MQLEQSTQWAFNVYLLRWVVSVHYRSLYFLLSLKKLTLREKVVNFKLFLVSHPIHPTL